MLREQLASAAENVDRSAPDALLSSSEHVESAFRRSLAKPGLPRQAGARAGILPPGAAPTFRRPSPGYPILTPMPIPIATSIAWYGRRAPPSDGKPTDSPLETPEGKVTKESLGVPTDSLLPIPGGRIAFV
jgi:hypothetical protein